MTSVPSARMHPNAELPMHHRSVARSLRFLQAAPQDSDGPGALPGAL
jgi:hypothetical protein